MCETRFTLVACTRWHVPHSSSSLAVLSCAFGAYRRVHAVAGDARHVARVVRAALPQRVRRPVWQDRQVSFAVARRHRWSNLLIIVSSAGSSMWREPGPWHVSHPCAAAGDRGCAALPCGVPSSVVVLVRRGRRGRCRRRRTSAGDAAGACGAACDAAAAGCWIGVAAGRSAVVAIETGSTTAARQREEARRRHGRLTRGGCGTARSPV